MHRLSLLLVTLLLLPSLLLAQRGIEASQPGGSLYLPGSSLTGLQTPTGVETVSVPDESVHYPNGETAWSAVAPPMNLGEPVPTGLQGFYDYQSNGMSPAWIQVDPSDRDLIHAVYMLSTDGASNTALSASRRVGYSVSADGGATWNPMLDISGAATRLGFPFLNLADLGAGLNPVIAVHGEPTGQLATIFYVDLGGSFTPLAETSPLTHSGRSGGVIWPAFQPHPDDPFVQKTISSLSFGEGESAAPLQITDVDFNGVGAEPWQAFGDSLLTATSGGRYDIAVSEGGKIGIAYDMFFQVSVEEFVRMIRFSESTDGGTTWSEPQIIFGGQIVEDFMINGDPDTLYSSGTLDLAYVGESANIVASGRIGSLYQLENILHWSQGGDGVQVIAGVSAEELRGRLTFPALFSQPNMPGMAYPAITVGDDGESVFVSFMAMGQRDLDPDPDSTDFQLITNAEGFAYFRLWGIGSQDGGSTWGDPFVLVDWAGSDRDSASIEYPSLNEFSDVDESGNMTIDLLFQARRNPGMYAFTVADVDGQGTPATAGSIEETYQYHLRKEIAAALFLDPDSDVLRPGARTFAGSIGAFPSSTSGLTEILYDVPSTGPVTLEVYNSVGQRVQTEFEQKELVSGTYSRRLDLGGLTAGSYRIVVRHPDGVVSTPVQIVR